MLYNKGNFVSSYNPIISRHQSGSSRAWRDGMISGNGEIGYVTSGEPYNDAFVFQNIFFNYPSADPRVIPKELTGQLEEARLNVFNLNDKWEIKDANGNRRHRTFYYSFHPGHQLRLKSEYVDNEKNYIRWTNYETGETGVQFEDHFGKWTRTSFTSRVDGVSVTKLAKSSENRLINMTVSIDDIDDMCRANDGLSKVSEQRYKKIVPADASYIAQIAHYPSYNGSELYDGGYAGVTMVIAEGKDATKTRVTSAKDDPMLLGDNAAIKIENAEAVYLITTLDRSFNMTGKTSGVMAEFEKKTQYDLLDKLVEKAAAAAEKYTEGGRFSYDAALAPSAEKQKAEFNRVSFELLGDEDFIDYDNNELIAEQRKSTKRINHEFMRRAYEQARYALTACGGTSAPRLYGMWTGEWNLGWRGIYTLDANVNLQVSPMNTSNMGGDFQEGYITFFLRHSPDFMYNAEMAYGMHDAIQPSVNVDADRGMHVEYDNAYPFEYWNAGASWCLLPIYEYWQCFGNQQIPINDYMRFDDLQKVLGVNDGGLSDEEFAGLKERGWLDLEQDILLPLLTKQANFWAQIVTPRYYMDANGNACHDESKTELLEGEKYMIIPTYSPENNPIGYNSTITANATMDIAAARDGLDMVCVIEKAVGREGYEAVIEKWQALKNSISDYKFDSDGALREWAMNEYTENNNHRHLSHLYVAWPAYDTQSDPELAKAANIALDNRNKYNTGDATAGHGWMHKALVEARLKRGDGMMKSLLMMMNGTAYYSSLITDHDTNRRNDTYCTDSTFGMMGAVNEALVFSNTGEIEIIPALPKDWTKGSVNGLMARTRVEVSGLSWDIDGGRATTTLTSLEDNNTVRLSCGEAWTAASIGGRALEVQTDERGNYVVITLDKNAPVTVEFTLSSAPNGTYLITKDGKYLSVNGIENGSEAVWGELSDSSYWNVENTLDGRITIRSCATGKYLTLEDGKLVQRNFTGEENQLFSCGEFDLTRLTEYRDVIITPDSFTITANGEEVDALTLASGESVDLGVKIEPAGASTVVTWSSNSIGSGVVSGGVLTAYDPGTVTVTATAAEGYSVSLDVKVTGNAKDIIKAEPVGITAADEGWSSAWRPELAFDGMPATAYSSKDDSPAKYIEVELAEPTAVTAAYVIGRFTAADGNGAFSGRINGAKIYASNTAGSRDVLVGEVQGVSATSAYIPQKVEIDTQGEAYKYYTLYFDAVNNGSNISLAVAELAFYTGGEGSLKKAEPTVTATAGSHPEYAADGNVNTAFEISNQAEGNFANQYIQFELNGVDQLSKIVVKKQIRSLGGNNTYWADHAFAVGCVLEGSFDGETWATVHTMNTWPDGTDGQSEVVIELSEPKAYKYVRYIRKEKNSYVGWAENGGNKLILADIEFYVIKPYVYAEIVNRGEESVTVSAESNVDGEYRVIAAAYDENRLLAAAAKPLVLESFVPAEITLDIKSEGEVSVFIWNDKLIPMTEKLTA